MAKPPLAPPPTAKAPVFDVERDDHIYFQCPKTGAGVGKVLAKGVHGVTVAINAAGQRRQVKHEHILGHKQRAQPALKVVDEGEDGFLAADARGKRRFISDPVPAEPKGQARTMAKSHMPMILLFTEDSDELAKAVANRPGLALRGVTDKGGHQTQRWMKTNPDQKKGRQPGADHGEVGSAKGYGTHNIEAGHHVEFAMGSVKGKGRVVGTPGKHGAHVEDETGRHHQVTYGEITGHKPAAKPLKGDEVPPPRAAQNPIPADQFAASDYAAAQDDPDATPESIMAQFPSDTAGKIAAAVDRLKGIEESIDTHKQGGNYAAERKALHRQIMFDGMEVGGKFVPGLLAPDRIKAATPEAGQAPTFTLLGGRGGAGKSSLAGEVYDPASAIVLDADLIKSMLPEYEGWNASQVHEESGDLFDLVTDTAQALGLNLVHDATMKTPAKAVALVSRFKGDGYRIEAHYMHLPRQEAARRAVQRFLEGGPKGRFVPPEVVLGNRENEASFDQVRGLADKWSFRDNNVPRGTPPILISEGGAGEKNDDGD